MAFHEEMLNSTKIYFVSQMDEQEPAWQCGVRRGDILLEINGSVLQTLSDESVSELIWESQKNGRNSELLMSRVTTPMRTLYTNFLDNPNDESDDDRTTLADLETQKKKDTQANQKESVQKDRDDEAPPPVQKTTEDLNDGDSPPFLVKEAITLKGIGDLQILDLDDGILAFTKLADTFVCEQQKHKNITKMLRIVNSQPNKGLEKAVSGIECPKNTGYQSQIILGGLICV